MRAPDSATATYDSSAASATPLAKREPVEDRGDRPVGVAAQQPAGAGVLDEVGLPVLDAVLPSRSRRTTPSRRPRSRRCCRHHADAVDACRPPPRRRRERVSTRSSPRCASQTSSRPSRSISIPSGRPPVSATRSTFGPVVADPPDRAVLGAGEDRPSSGPWVATTTSSAPGPGTGMTRELCWGSWRCSPESCWRTRSESRKPGTDDGRRSGEVEGPSSAAGSTKTIWRPSLHSMSASVRSTGAAKTVHPVVRPVGLRGRPRWLSTAAGTQGRAGRPVSSSSSLWPRRLGVLARARRGRRAVPTSPGRCAGSSSRSWSRIHPRLSTRITPAKRRVTPRISFLTAPAATPEHSGVSTVASVRRVRREVAMTRPA